MSETSHDLIDLRRLLAPVGVERFFCDYWQRRMLALPLDASDFSRIIKEIGRLDIARLAAAATEGTQAWLANDYVEHSVIPVDASNAEKFFGMGATLYFLNVPLERLTGGVATFLGAPRQKVIASLFLSPAGGGASPHFDANENFTIQLTGTKRWMVGNSPLVPAPPEGYMLGQNIPKSLLGLVADDTKEEPGQSVEMRPGTLLYVPRGTVHRTEAGEVSWSLNLSYSRKIWLDLICFGLRRHLAGSAQWRGTVTGLGKSCDPAAQAANILPELLVELHDLLSDPDEVDKLVEEFFKHPDI